MRGENGEAIESRKRPVSIAGEACVMDMFATLQQLQCAFSTARQIMEPGPTEVSNSKALAEPFLGWLAENLEMLATRQGRRAGRFWGIAALVR
jgi:hypothetical protein